MDIIAKSPKYSKISTLGQKYAKVANMHCFLFDGNGVPRYCIGPHCNIN